MQKYLRVRKIISNIDNEDGTVTVTGENKKINCIQKE